MERRDRRPKGRLARSTLAVHAGLVRAENFSSSASIGESAMQTRCVRSPSMTSGKAITSQPIVIPLPSPRSASDYFQTTSIAKK